jgi:HEPN domain-containing protein
MSMEEFEVWLQRAESNLHIARRGRGEGVFLEDLCFEAQQAAEKALKALLIYLSGDYPRVHTFTLLLERLEQHVAVLEPIRETTPPTRTNRRLASTSARPCVSLPNA